MWPGERLCAVGVFNYIIAVKSLTALLSDSCWDRRIIPLQGRCKLFLLKVSVYQANLMLSGKEGKLAPNENGDNRNELGALGYSHQHHGSGCLGSATQFLGLLLFFSFRFRTGLHWLNQTKPMGGLFSKCQEGELVLWTWNYRERDIWQFISLPATKHICFWIYFHD